jgi:hypothetical protein
MHIDESKKFDKRTIERDLREGNVSAKEWEQFLKKLPDVSDKVDFFMLEEGQQQAEAGEEGKEKEEKETTEDKGERSEEFVGEETTPEKE